MRNLKRGDVGHDVAEWQVILGITSDGVFGAQTEAATKAWQQAHGLTADGIVGPASRQTAGIDQKPTFKPPPILLRGIDVSPVQGKVPWAAVAAAGIKFAMVRCIVGNERPDRSFRSSIFEAKANGIAAGGYCFLYPLPHLSARGQAQQHVRALEMCGGLDGELRPMADLEWPPPFEYHKNPDGTKFLFNVWKKWGCTKEQIAEFFLTYLDETDHLTGLKWIRYTYRYFGDSVEMHKYPEFADGPLCLADYWAAGRVPTAEQVAKLKVPGPWTKISIVQHDGDGGLRLPNGVDADFNVMPGGAEVLKEFTTGSKDWAPLGHVVPAARIIGHDDFPGLLRNDEIRHYRQSRLYEAPVEAA